MRLPTGDGDDPGGSLRVTPAGSVVVATDALLASADRLRALEAALHDDLRRVVAADAVVTGLPIPGIAPRLQHLRERCESARDAFTRVAEEYTRGEVFVEGLQRKVAEIVAATAGPALLGMLARLVMFSPQTLLLGGLLGWAAIPAGSGGRLGTVRDFFLQNPQLITSPEFTRFVSLLATSIDDGVLGISGMPGVLAGLPGAELSPAGGVAAGAFTVAAAGSALGMFRETAVATERVSTTRLDAAPVGVRERLDRIPEVNQVRIEKYEAEGMPPRYGVFIGPTETFSPYADTDPWDLTSNVVGVAGLSPGSLRAVEQAMADAGIQPGDEVLVAGFSQGGLVATRVAASGDWNVVAVETHGAPAGHIQLPEGVSGLAIRNTDDFIPALAGPQLDHALVQVEREAFAGDAPLPTTEAAPAHQRTAYERTATAIDAAESRVVREQIDRLDSFAADYLARPGGQATVMTYRSTRLTGD